MNGYNVLPWKCKHGETYLFIYDDAHAGEMRSTIGRFALDTDLSLSKADALKLLDKMDQKPDRFVLPMPESQHGET